ncbi:MAG: carboxymethylenebutenolidase [Deltaproteobacteria bacterium HGW-Deltaproteobacteria-15]|nr:MAG: carboxymethylenebutenolidase [Deltaproteobacteria bacterium HGW-Deltaproteobacteria-15]
MDQRLMDLTEEYAPGSLDRREFLMKLGIVAGGTAAAGALMPLLGGDCARAQVTAKDDAALVAEHMKYPGETGEIRAYFARPKKDAKYPGVVVIHENRGLNAHIEDVTRRIALEGFVAMAPDALSPVGGTPGDQDKAIELIGKLDREKTIRNYVAAVRYLKTHPVSTGKVGTVGFCWGGGMANQLAVHSPELTAAVPYYGPVPASGDVPRIKASLLLHYAGQDERINSGIPAFEEALKKAKVDYRVYMYENAQHAFNNDTNAARYNKEAAQLAWQRTISFLKDKLKT